MGAAFTLGGALIGAGIAKADPTNAWSAAIVVGTIILAVAALIDNYNRHWLRRD